MPAPRTSGQRATLPFISSAHSGSGHLAQILAIKRLRCVRTTRYGYAYLLSSLPAKGSEWFAHVLLQQSTACETCGRVHQTVCVHFRGWQWLRWMHSWQSWIVHSCDISHAEVDSQGDNAARTLSSSFDRLRLACRLRHTLMRIPCILTATSLCGTSGSECSLSPAAWHWELS